MRNVVRGYVVVLGLLFSFGLLACGNGSSTPAAVADFSVAINPTSVSLTAGGTAQTITITATAVNNFTGTVAVAIAGLPAGVTAKPASLTLTPGAGQTVSLTAAATAAAGTATITATGTSGTLTHAATTALTVAGPPPDFTLSASPASLTLTAGTTGQAVSILATAVNAFTGTVSVAITGLPNGVNAAPTTLSLTPGTAQAVTLTAPASVVAGTATVTFTGISGTLSHRAVIALTIQPATMTAAPDVTTYHYDNARDGLNAAETILTPTNVTATQFGKIGFDTVDGKVDAEPLFLANVAINGQLHNVLYVATEHDSVYAFDADSGAQLWMASLLGPGETTVTDFSTSCDQIAPEIGITSTPVIDRKQGVNGTLFTVGMSKDTASAYHHRLHALDLTTGAEMTGSPSEVTGTYPGTGENSQNGNVIFDPGQYAERAALLLTSGTIYTTWTSHCDAHPYTGWVMAYGESTLKQTQVLNLTPNGSQGSVWMSGDGLAADSTGNLYLLDANGTFDMGFDGNGFPTKGDFGNGILKLSNNAAGALAVTDFFEPYNTDDESNNDQDVGSGGEILLPDLQDASGKTQHLVVGAGKDQHIYVGNRDNLGKFNSNTSDNSNIYQDIPGVVTGAVFSTPAYFNGTLYYNGVNDTLKAIPVVNAKVGTALSSQSATIFGYPGAIPAVSANGTGAGIVWALQSSVHAPAVLHAYDATNLANELYNSNQAANGRDAFGDGNKYITPLIVNGKVYVGTQTGVAIFGLISQ